MHVSGSGPIGPFDTMQEAIDDCRENAAWEMD